MTKLELAEKQALLFKEYLSPYCKRVEIAGGIRRRKPDPHDIEIVMVVDPAKWFELARLSESWNVCKGNIGGKMMQLASNPFGSMAVDLFVAQVDNFGLIYMIRTGSAEFSKRMMGVQAPRAGLSCDGGWLRKDGKALLTPEETDVFRALRVSFVPPEKRVA